MPQIEEVKEEKKSSESSSTSAPHTPTINLAALLQTSWMKDMHAEADSNTKVALLPGGAVVKSNTYGALDIEWNLFKIEKPFEMLYMMHILIKTQNDEIIAETRIQHDNLLRLYRFPFFYDWTTIEKTFVQATLRETEKHIVFIFGANPTCKIAVEKQVKGNVLNLS